MYIKKSRATIGGKIYEYLRLVQGIRVGSKIKHRVVAYLGRTDDPTSAASFLFHKVPLEQNQQQARLYALPMACYHIMQSVLDLPTLFMRVFPPSVPKNIFLLIKLMILSRIINPESKLSLTRWYHHLYLPEELPKEIDVHEFYKTLDYLMEYKAEIEKCLFKRLQEQKLIDITVIFYDLTSSYFEGEDVEIAKYGYSRDHRPDRIQITLGLVIDRSGLPLYHEVFEGNVSDQKTVKGILSSVKETLGIQQVLFVADKGMLSADNIQELEKEGYTYILSQSVRTGYTEQEAYLAKKAAFTKLTDTLWYTKTAVGILCYNPFTAKHAKATRDAHLVKLTEFIEQEQAKEGKEKRKQSKQTIHDRIIKRLQSSYMGKYFDEKDNFKRKEEMIKKEELLDGAWVLITNDTTMTPEQIIHGYKQEAIIESTFRIIKDVIELRPVYHYNTNRVRGHVFICVLSYLVAKLLEQKTGQTIKKLKEEYMTSVIIDGETRTSPKQIIGGSIKLNRN